MFNILARNLSTYTIHTLDMCVVIRTFDMYTKRRHLFIIAIRTSVQVKYIKKTTKVKSKLT